MTGAERIDQIRFDQRQKRQVAGCGVATHPTDVICRGEFFTVQFGQPVNEFAQPLRGSVFFAVPFFVKVRIPQTEIGRQVDDFARQRGVLVDVMLGLSMWLGQEKYVHRLDLGRVDEFESGLLAQIGMHLVNVLAQVRARSDLLDFHRRVRQQQPQQFPAAISRTADNRNCRHNCS